MSRPIVVIGGGIVGTTIAYELQRVGAPAILVERDLEPQGASAFSFASLTALDEPQRDAYLLKTHGMIAWRELAKVFGDDLGAHFAGELRWAESPHEGRHLTSMIDRATGRGYPVRSISADEISKREPASQARDVASACFVPNDGQADPLRAIDVMRGSFADGGGTILIGRASLMVEELGITVRVGDDRVEASTVVVATGSETTTMLERLGWEIPMDPSPGLLAVTKPTDPFLEGTVYVYPQSGLSVHLRQMSDGRVLMGERAQDEVAKNPTLEHARSLLRQAQRSFPALETTQVDHFTVEWRPMPRDGMPIVGRLQGCPSLYVATGHSGVTTAPAVARFVTQEIVHGTEAERLKPFRPSRFSAHRSYAYTSIEEAFNGAPDLFIG